MAWPASRDRHQRICFALALWNGARPDPEGAAVRPDRQRGEPRRGRQGVLLLPGHHADAPLHAVPLQVSAARVPLRAAGRGEPPARSQRPGVRAGRHRRLRRRSLLRRVRRVREGRARRHPDRGSRAHNRGPEAAPLHLLPTMWFRNTWSWGEPVVASAAGRGPTIRLRAASIALDEPALRRRAGCIATARPSCSFTDNETNTERLFGAEARGVRQGRHQRRRRARPARRRQRRRRRHQGGRALRADGAGRWRSRSSAAPRAMSRPRLDRGPFGGDFDADLRGAAARGRRVLRDGHPGRPLRRCPQRDAAGAGRRAVVEAVLPLRGEGLAERRSRASRRRRTSGCTGATASGRTSTTRTSSRCPTSGSTRGTRRGIWPSTACPLALVDPEFAKEQLVLLLREWYMHPNGQLPAYEWAFGDVNPPVHAWAAWRVYKIEKKRDRRRRPGCSSSACSRSCCSTSPGG